MRGTPRSVHFGDNVSGQYGPRWSILTGRNGSYKSTIFREIVQGLILWDGIEGNPLKLIRREGGDDSPPRVLAVSGTVADRFPLKHQNIKTTVFDQPNYVYFGQRVNANIISKREIIEHVAFYMLDSKVEDRLSTPFHIRIYELLGLRRFVELRVESAKSPNENRRSNQPPLFETLSNVANYRSQIGAGAIQYSAETARFLLDEFSRATFDELHKFLHGTRRKVHAVISGSIETQGLGADAIRLGLYVEKLRITSVTVESLDSEKGFSAFDLSSGEYHLWSTLLAICFSVQNGDVVLIDEPETSLHPQWQIEYMRLLNDITAFMTNGHIVVSTHSPLMISAARPGASVIDVSEQQSSSSKIAVNFAGSADDILVNRFGLKSSRNHDFVDKLQRAIHLVELGDDNGEEFEVLSHTLSSYRALLPDTDPITDIIDALIKTEQ